MIYKSYVYLTIYDYSVFLDNLCQKMPPPPPVKMTRYSTCVEECIMCIICNCNAIYMVTVEIMLIFGKLI